MNSLQITWEEYHRSIEELAIKIYQDDHEFDQILCLARGGLRIGDILSRLFDLPLAILSTSSYNNVGERGKLTISRHITMTNNQLGDRLLLLDDLVDSGVTLVETVNYLKQNYGHIESIHTGVIWYKGCSVYQPDYYVHYLPDNPWINQPFEIYDRLSLKTLAQRNTPLN